MAQPDNFSDLDDYLGIGGSDDFSDLDSYLAEPEDPYLESVKAEIGYNAEPEQTQDDSWEITKGLKSAAHGLKATTGGLIALGGDAFDSDDLREYGLDVYQGASEKAQESGGRVTDYENIRTDGFFNFLNDATDYALQAVGQMVPTAAAIVAGGGIGGVIGKAAAKKAVTSFLANRTGKKASEKAVQKLTNQVLKRAAQRGQIAGAMTGSTGLETGSIYGDIAQEGGEGSKAILSSLAGGALAGSLDALPVMAVARKFGFGGDYGNFLQEHLAQAGLKQRVGEMAAATGVFEGGTEAIQTLIEEATKAYALDRNLPDDIAHHMINAGLTGFFGGAALGGLGGIPRQDMPQQQQPINLGDPENTVQTGPIIPTGPAFDTNPAQIDKELDSVNAELDNILGINQTDSTIGTIQPAGIFDTAYQPLPTIEELNQQQDGLSTLMNQGMDRIERETQQAPVNEPVNLIDTNKQRKLRESLQLRRDARDIGMKKAELQELRDLERKAGFNFLSEGNMGFSANQTKPKKAEQVREGLTNDRAAESEIAREPEITPGPSVEVQPTENATGQAIQTQEGLADEKATASQITPSDQNAAETQEIQAQTTGEVDKVFHKKPDGSVTYTGVKQGDLLQLAKNNFGYLIPRNSSLSESEFANLIEDSNVSPQAIEVVKALREKQGESNRTGEVNHNYVSGRFGRTNVDWGKTQEPYDSVTLKSGETYQRQGDQYVKAEAPQTKEPLQDNAQSVVHENTQADVKESFDNVEDSNINPIRSYEDLLENIDEEIRKIEARTKAGYKPAEPDTITHLPRVIRKTQANNDIFERKRHALAELEYRNLPAELYDIVKERGVYVAKRKETGLPKRTGYTQFKVIGDGVFNIRATPEALKNFKKRVQKESLAFKNEERKPKRRRFSKGSVANTPTISTLKDMIADGEYENAYYFAQAINKPLYYYNTKDRPIPAIKDKTVKLPDTYNQAEWEQAFIKAYKIGEEDTQTETQVETKEPRKARSKTKALSDITIKGYFEHKGKAIKDPKADIIYNNLQERMDAVQKIKACIG